MKCTIRSAVFAAAASVAVTMSSVANAQTLGIGTNPQGSLAFAVGSAIAKLVSENTDLNMRVVPQGGPNVTLPLINNGELQFSISNTEAIGFAQSGTVIFDAPLDNVLTIGALNPLLSSFYTRADSDIKTLADLAGRKVTAGYNNQTIVLVNATSVLNTVGLTYDDVDQVPVANGVRAVEDFASGNAEAVYMSLTAGVTRQADATVGGIRVLSIPDDSPETLAAIREIAPTGSIRKVEPGGNIPGIEETTYIFESAFFLNVSKDVPNDVVRTITQLIAENKPALVESVGAFRGFNPARMLREDLGLNYHPGALEFYNQ